MKNFKPKSKLVLEELSKEPTTRQVSHDEKDMVPQGNVTPPINQQPR